MWWLFFWGLEVDRSPEIFFPFFFFFFLKPNQVSFYPTHGAPAGCVAPPPWCPSPWQEQGSRSPKNSQEDLHPRLGQSRAGHWSHHPGPAQPQRQSPPRCCLVGALVSAVVPAERLAPRTCAGGTLLAFIRFKCERRACMKKCKSKKPF